jgi:hydrogenase maturation factor
MQGAEPLFFLDYLSTGRLSPEVAESIVGGMASACRDNGCALLGGETAEMPGFYRDGEYDLAGFIVGVVDRNRLINGRTIAIGDVLVGVPSSGLHTNGYSLARRIAFDQLRLTVDSHVPELGRTLGEPFLSFEDALFCDRAVIGGWPRTDEPIKPYTVAETMDSGWCWQIEHENWINRGYVYSSPLISDQAALDEF